MTDELRERLREASGGPVRSLDLALVSHRGTALRRRRRHMQVLAGTIGAGVVALTVLGLTSGRGGGVTKVRVTAPTTPNQGEYLVLRNGDLDYVDAADGRVLGGVHLGGAGDVFTGPLAVTGDGRTAYGVVAHGITCAGSTVEAVDLANGTESALEGGDTTAPAVSPDGKRVAWLRLGGGSDGCSATAVTVLELDGGHQETWSLPDAGSGSSALGATLTWAPDGRRLVVGGVADDSTGVEILDTAGPGTGANPQIVELPTGPTGPRLMDAALADDGRLTALEVCGRSRPCAVAPYVVRISDQTGVPTEVSVVSPAGLTVQPVGLLLDQRGAGLSLLVAAAPAPGADLPAQLDRVEAGRLRLVLTDVLAATWLPPAAERPAAGHP